MSEILGLQEKHLDFANGTILVRQRYYRGDLDEVKNQKARRDVPMGYLADSLKAACKGGRPTGQQESVVNRSCGRRRPGRLRRF